MNASNLRSYCWYTRHATDSHLSTSRSCSCLINPDTIYDQKPRAFWMSLGLLKFGGCAFSISASRLWNALLQHLKDSTSCKAFKKRLKTHLFRLAHWGFVDCDSNYDNVQHFRKFYEWKGRYINFNHFYYYYYYYYYNHYYYYYYSNYYHYY